MGSSIRKPTPSIDLLLQGLDSSYLDKSGKQIYKQLYEEAKYPEITVFNRIRFQPLLHKYPLGTPSGQAIRESLQQMNQDAQQLFQQKWPTMPRAE